MSVINQTLPADDSAAKGGQKDRLMDGSNGFPILVVDDEPVALNLCTKVLGRIGLCDVDQAANGKEALVKIGERRYAAVISDWNMPEMNGLELVWRIRADETLRRMPFIMTSVDGGLDRARIARQAGVNAFLIKPFDAAQLTAKLNEVLPIARFRPKLKASPVFDAATTVARESSLARTGPRLIRDAHRSREARVGTKD